MGISNRCNSTRARVAGLLVCLGLLFAISAWPLDIPSSTSSVEVLKTHAHFLASDKLTGRGVDTPGIGLARDYIAADFAKLGLQPGGDNGSYLQSFEVATGVRVKQPTSLTLGNQPALTLNQDWTPLGFSVSKKVEAPVVFAGYGITAKEYGYDDYESVDAKGKIVIVLRYEPPPKHANSPFRRYPNHSVHAALRTKANNARDHGALGMILVDLNPQGDAKGELIPTTNSLWRAGTSLVAAQARRAPIEKWLGGHGVSLTELRDKIDHTETPASTEVPAGKATLEVNLEEIRQPTENVVAVLPGSDPRLKNESVVIGAHYDHIGFGHYGTRQSSTEGEVHHGADDNASGTAVLLEVARRLSRTDIKPARTIVFAAFSAEELGLFGSRHYVNHPAVPLSSTKAMINLDMVGRLRDGRVTVFGTRSAEEFSGIVKSGATELGLEISESDGIGRSDHMSFYGKKIPALHFFTGVHSDYHGPGDTWDKLNLEGMAKITELVLSTVRSIANTNAPLNFVSLPSRSGAQAISEGGASTAYLGTIPDYSAAAEGVRLAGVSAGSPAALAGLREGDVIVMLAETKVHNLEDLMFALGRRKPGDEVEIVVLRGTQPLKLKAVLRARA
ncbi:MAG TPA: M20/M25/M40 family metallo-hydrolase [Candidatus Binatia bacterium]|nr:M20/M25/M40 family metallo-hydrolase [Candidatus Binatia bacterium]